MDICDMADQQNEIAFQHDLRSSRKPEVPVANGSCHFCNEDVPAGHRWCDFDCMNSWEMRGRGAFVD